MDKLVLNFAWKDKRPRIANNTILKEKNIVNRTYTAPNSRLILKL